MKDLAEALTLVLEGVEPLETESVPLTEARGRVIASEAHAVIDLPPFDRTAMDGFAVRAEDVAPGAKLRVVGDLAAGGATLVVEPGTAARISTGAAIPEGADAVVPIEQVLVRDDGFINADVIIDPGRHVRRRGEDLHAGDVLARPGDVLTVPRLSALASAGVADVRAPRLPRLDLIVTGSELLPAGAPPEPGKIYESNSLVVASMVSAVGANVVHHPPVADDFAATREAVERGLEGDILVVSGGVSVGPHDHVKPAFEACGVEEIFWRVRIKPGKPLWFGRRGRTLVFGLPGNPLSAIVGTAVFVIPALRRLRGETRRRPALRARPARRARRPVRQPHDVPDLQARARRRRRARSLPDRTSGLAHDRRARRERRVRDRAARLRPARSRRRRRPVAALDATG